MTIPLDPEIAGFIAKMGEGWSQHPPLDSVPVNQQRAIAEKVRGPWTKGGPEMAKTTEHRVPTAYGDVLVRLYRPADAPQNSPVLLYMHGGGWTIFSINTHDRLMREYAGRAGICVAGIDYSLSPEHRYPRALDECVDVAKWLATESETLGIDPARIATGGDSAGANLALSTAIRLRDEKAPAQIAAMLLNYGAFDTDCRNGSYIRFGGPGAMLGGQEMEDFWRNYLGDDFDNPEPLAVPLHADLHGLPPALLIVPDCDVLLDENIEMDRRLKAAGVTTQTEFYKGASHSFLEAVTVSKLAKQAHRDTADWLIAQLHP